MGDAGLPERAAGSSDAAGAWTLSVSLADGHLLSGLRFTGQVLTFVPGGPLAGTVELSNGIDLRLGYPR